HTHTHTHTHTHRHLASPNLFLRARRSYANLMKHKGYSYLWCYVFRTLSATDIRENKERFYRQNLHDFRAVNYRTSININSHSADRPHVGTDPVSVRRHLGLIHAQSLGSYLDNMFIPSVKRTVRTDTGSVPTCGLVPELASVGLRIPSCSIIPSSITPNPLPRR
ncbi:hypothetical protein HMPREF9140_01989, partial [Prevotella micans F0438]